MFTDRVKLEVIKKTKALVIGDFILDEYIFGDVNRISPEAVVPIVKMNKIDYRLGGAGNVVANIVALGGNARALTLLGNDKEGRIIKSKLSEIGCDISLIKQTDEVTTVLKTRIVSSNSQLLRIDREEYYELPQWYMEEVKNNYPSYFQDINVVIVSDYNKGAASKELIKVVTDYANFLNIPIIVDPKGNQIEKYKNVTLCTPNMKELAELAGQKTVTEEHIVEAVDKLLKKGIRNVLVTRSEEGMTLFEGSKRTDYPTMAKDVVDVTGAGDTVVAMAACALAARYTMDVLCKLSNIAASITVTSFGTSAVTFEKLLEKIRIINGTDKLITADEAQKIAEKLKEDKKKIVFTNGCFDLCHPGHIHLLKEAVKRGDILVVGLNSDKSIKRIKGYLRPVIDEENRAYVLSSIEAVDYVVIFDEDTPLELIKKIKPDVLVKGEDWKGKKVVGEDVLSEYGGTIEFVETYESFSTTRLISMMQGNQ